MIWNFLSSAGWPSLPIVACSVVTLGLLLERAFFWTMLVARRDGRLFEELSTLTVDRRRAERTHDPLCRMLYRLIRHPAEPRLARGAARRLADEARAGIGAIELAGLAARGLGVAGAAIGIAAALEGGARPEAVAEALGAGLRALALGILVSLPAHAGAAALRALAERLALRAQRALEVVGARLRTRSLGAVTYAT